MSERAPLQRADWRFLLPGEEPRRLLVVRGGPPGLGAVLVAAGAAREVVERPPAGRRPDAVALLAGEDGLESATSSLAPGGAVYWEIRRADLPRARRRLAAAGLQVTGSWAVWRSFERPEAYLPIEGGEALAWFGRAYYPARNWRDRVVRARLALGQAALTRNVGLVAVAGGGSGALPSLLAHPELAVAHGGGSVHLAVLGHGAERVTLITFPSTGGIRRVLKVPRCAAANARTEHDQEARVKARARVAGAQREAIPEPLGVARWCGLMVGIESFAPGRTLAWRGGWGEEAAARRFLGDLRLATEWLIGLHAATETRRPRWDSAAAERWLERPAAAFRERHGSAPAVELLVADARAHSALLHGLPLPVVCRHRDFTPWNLLRDGDRISVLDWEGAEAGPALCDLLHFAVHWHEHAAGALEPAERLRAFRSWLRRAEDRFAAAAWSAVDAYCVRLGIDPRFVPLLLVATRLEIASRAHAQPGGLDCGFVALLAEEREHLFARAAA